MDEITFIIENIVENIIDMKTINQIGNIMLCSLVNNQTETSDGTDVIFLNRNKRIFAINNQ